MSEPPPPASAGTSRRRETRLPALGPRGEGWFAVQLVLVLVVAGVGWLFGDNWAGAPRFATSLAGAVLLLAGGALIVLGLRDLDRSISPFPMPRPDGVMVEHGVYRRVRHPIYAGVSLSGIGWALFSASLPALAVALVLAVVLDLKARREEGWLRQRYPSYAAYSARTRRFVPGIY